MNRYCIIFKDGRIFFVKTKQYKKRIMELMPDIKEIHLTKDIEEQAK